MKTAILSWLQNDGSRELLVDRLKGNNFLMFRSDFLVVSANFNPKDN